MRPWSPAPWLAMASSAEPSPVRASCEVSTPWAISGDCWPIEIDTPQETPSKPLSEES